MEIFVDHVLLYEKKNISVTLPAICGMAVVV